jgi:hypothetical protein
MSDNIQLTIQDLISMRSIIDTACTRGAFQASEMRNVGEVYDRLSSFLDNVVAEAEKATTQGETSND